MCHVYSDRSLAELITWGREHSLKSEWIDRRNALPHFDAFRDHLERCGPGVGRAELVGDLRWWRERRDGIDPTGTGAYSGGNSR